MHLTDRKQVMILKVRSPCPCCLGKIGKGVERSTRASWGSSRSSLKGGDHVRYQWQCMLRTLRSAMYDDVFVRLSHAWQGWATF